jgi:hypothetical protein
MTEYELQDLAFSAGGIAGTYGSIWITIISGYLLVAYVAGRDLSRPQVSLVNLLFLFTSGLFAYGTIPSLGKQLSIVNMLRAIHPDNFYPTTEPIVTAVAVIFGLIILASLKFMWDVRPPKTE